LRNWWFFGEAYEYLKKNCSAQDWQILQKSIIGAEAKSLPLMLAHMSLLYMDLNIPILMMVIVYGLLFRRWVKRLGRRDSHKSAVLGVRRKTELKITFPQIDKLKKRVVIPSVDYASSRQRPKPGRAAVVFPNGVLFGDGICAKLKEDLLKNFNLHTMSVLPNGVFAPYTSIPQICYF
jgi:type I restriction enzyme M protein